MNNREARAALREWGAATTQMVRKRQRLEQVAQLADTAMLLEKYGSNSGGSNEQVQLFREEINRLGQEMEYYLRQKRRLDEFINSLPSLYQQLLGLRYIEGRKWTYIARKLNYAEASARRFETEVLRLLQTWK